MSGQERKKQQKCLACRRAFIAAITLAGISKFIKANKVSVLKAKLGTEPLVYCVGDVNE
jgi:hypothetical protein